MLLPGQRMLVFRQLLDSDPEEMLCTIGVSELNFDEDADILQAADNAWNDNMLALMVTSYQLFAIDLVRQEVGGTVVQTRFVGGQGFLDEDSAPPNVTYLGRKFTTAIGRGKNGRIYIPGVAEALVDNTGAIDGAHVASLSAALGNLQQQFEFELTDTVMVVNRSTGGGSTPTITSWLCDPRVATQRRRLRP